MADNTKDNGGGSGEFCLMCGRSDKQAGKMVHMPGGITICPDCMQKAMDAASRIDLTSLLNNPMFGQNNPFFKGFTGMDPGTDSSKAQTDIKADDGAQSDGKADGGTQSAKAAADRASEEAPESNSLTVPEERPNDSKGDSGKDLPEAGGEDDPRPKEEDDEDESRDDSEESGGRRQPSISFLNLSDLLGAGFGGRQQPKVKKKKKTGPKPVFSIDDMPAPHKIKEELDKYIIGQERAKKVISVAAYNHYKRVRTGTMDDIEIEKSNILLLGPTGCGKTYIVRTLARLLDVPLAIADATSLTEAGYIGDDIESVISKLLAAADNDVEKTEKGIVFIDEIDKIAKKKNFNSRDVSGESVQQGLLKLLEGADVEVPVGASSKNAMVPLTTINTRNILFICGGAFPDLEQIIRERLNKKTSMGFSAEIRDKYDKEKNIMDLVTNDDLRKFGMIPEFIGRLPIICPLQGLNADMLVKILKEPQNAIIKQYQKLLALDEVKLEFEDDALYAIAEKAMEKDTGARALRSIIEEFMLDIMYEIPKDENIGTVTITRAYVEGKGGPKIVIRSESAGSLPAIEQK